MALCNEDGQVQPFELGNGGASDPKAINPILRHMPREVFVTVDTGFDSKTLRPPMRYQQARPVCPRRPFKHLPTRRTPKPYIDKLRWIIEQAFSRTNSFRKLTVRYERNPDTYKQAWYLGLAWLDIQKLTG